MLRTIQEIKEADLKIYRDAGGKLTFNTVEVVAPSAKAYGIPLPLLKKIVREYGLLWNHGATIERPGFYGLAEILRLEPEAMTKVLALREAAEQEWTDRSEALRDLCEPPELYDEYIQLL